MRTLRIVTLILAVPSAIGARPTTSSISPRTKGGSVYDPDHSTGVACPTCLNNPGHYI